MIYPREIPTQERVIRQWRERTLELSGRDKPVMQPLYVDLVEDPNFAPRPIHLGYRVGAARLVRYLQELASVGVNHVALNLRFNGRDVEETLRSLASEVLPAFTRR